MNRLKSKVAIVTRAALGLGRATVVRMAEEGACVAIFDMLDEGGQASANQLTARSADDIPKE